MLTSPWIRCLGVVCLLAGGACAPHSSVAVEAPVQPLRLSESGPTAAQSSASSGSVTPERERESRELGRTWGWVLAAGVGGVAGVFAVGTSVAMLLDKGIRDSDCNASKGCSPSGLDANTQIANLANWNTAAWILAVAGVGTGAYLLLTNPSAQGTQVGLVPNGSGANVSLRTVF
ncbi:MAG: hypothetical protein ABTD50_20685 [Polyangiaceae bacterium]